ncbi:MAG: NAD-dependent epimerase/dehydratase family protein [Rhodospirillaceae bacterium]
MTSPQDTRVLITGAAGAIGSTLREGLAGRYALLRLADRQPLAAPGAKEEAVTCDITDAAAVAALMPDIDCIVHLAGVPREGPWEAIHPNNIVGTYNVFEQARLHGVRRIVYASSNHVIGYYRADRRVGVDVPARPDSRYGVSKVFGEALGRLYADKHAMSVASLRIGSFRKRPEDARQLATWISPRDMTELVRCAIEAPDYHYIVVYGVSANRRARWDNTDAQRIGYVPRDDAEQYAALFRDAGKPNDPAVLFHGGGFCALEWNGNVDDID